MDHCKPLRFSILLCGILSLAGCGGGDSGPSPIYLVSGTIYIETGNDVDSDINGTFAIANIANNSFYDSHDDHFQALKSPAIVGGYVNQLLTYSKACIILMTYLPDG